MDNNSRCFVTKVVFLKNLLPWWVEVLHRRLHRRVIIVSVPSLYSLFHNIFVIIKYGNLHVELARQYLEQTGPMPAQQGPPVLKREEFFDWKHKSSLYLVTEGQLEAILLYKVGNLVKSCDPRKCCFSKNLCWLEH